MTKLSPEELERRDSEDQLEGMMKEIGAKLLGLSSREQRRLLQSCGLWDMWNRFSHEPVWKRCRHGGPKPEPAVMDKVHKISKSQIWAGFAPSLAHVQLLRDTCGDPKLNPPAMIFASMALDAWINKDVLNTKKFLFQASVLDYLSSASVEGFLWIACDLAGGGQTRSVPALALARLKHRLEQLRSSSTAMIEMMNEFITCDCLERFQRTSQGYLPGEADRIWSRHHSLFKQSVGRRFRYDGRDDCVLIDVFADGSALLKVPHVGVKHVLLAECRPPREKDAVHSVHEATGVWYSSNGSCIVHCDGKGDLLYKEQIDACSCLQGRLRKMHGENSWEADLHLLVEGEPLAHASSDDFVGRIRITVTCNPTKELHTQIMVANEDDDWQPCVVWRRERPQKCESDDEEVPSEEHSADGDEEDIYSHDDYDRISDVSSDSLSQMSDSGGLSGAYANFRLPFTMYFGHGGFQQACDEFHAIDLKEEAQALQRRGDYEKALPKMLRSVRLREGSHTICLSLSELADLYLDMLKFDEAESTCQRMKEEASSPYRYDDHQQKRVAASVLSDVSAERVHGLFYGMRVEISGLRRSDLNGRLGVVRGRFADSSRVMRIIVQVGSERVLVERHRVRPLSPASTTTVTPTTSFAEMFAKIMEPNRRGVASSYTRSSERSADTSRSNVSIIATGKCFLPGTRFRCPDGSFASVETLEAHESLLAHDGNVLEVFDVITHEAEERELVLLRTKFVTLVVTANHRIVVPRGAGHQTIPASHLRPGDVVVCKDREAELEEVARFTSRTNVFEVKFRPDVAIETFCDAADAIPILTKGSKLISVKTRRAGMNKEMSAQPLDYHKQMIVQPLDVRTWDSCI
eukprot:TRINITY_DN15165_c0_g3_i1.p1 TRINITY_DN15165_c0_g3~~TRINITY_DN15165_c0_g3_i1.p1  ORF type:complete len:915 (-),score=119.86 TRINITY_DN15165_c0_g3_i1:214-2799(-)